MGPINLNETVRTLEGVGVRVLQIITAAVTLAVLTACSAALIVHAARTPDPAQAAYADLTLVSILTLAHLVLAAGAWGLAFVLYRKRLARPFETPPTAADCLAALRTATVLRLAVLEAPALFGAIVCLIASQRGVLDVEPLYWLNLASAAAFVAAAVLTFPTRDRVTVIVSGMMTGQGA